MLREQRKRLVLVAAAPARGRFHFSALQPIVVLGQAYLGKNAGFASGVTLGLSTTIGGILAPVVGWAADRWGMVTALQILWIAGVFGSLAAFTLREPEKL